MLHNFSARLVFCGLVLLAITSIVFARFYLQAVLGLEVCPLCMTQRALVLLWGVIALAAAVHNPHGWGRRVYASMCGLAAFAGAAVASRHVWLQHLPEDQVPACGPSLDFMLENLPFQETVSLVLMGDGNCAETVWTFLGFSIPEQTLGIFLIAMMICLWQALRLYPDQVRPA